MNGWGTRTLIALSILLPQAPAPAQTAPSPRKIIIDTDLGDDIDDAFALTLALRSPELQVLGITTTFGDTALRARLADRLLADTGHADIPVAAGHATEPKTPFTQARYALARPDQRSHPDAVSFILEQIRRYPGEITLVAIGPLNNIGALIDKDPATFRKLREVVLMGGSIDRGYGDLDLGPAVGPVQSRTHGPDAEWNIANDPASAQKLLESGVPLFFLPLDSTQLKLDETKRSLLFAQGNPYTDALALLYFQWGQQTPTLFDPMTIAWLLNPSLCPMEPLRLRVDRGGFTRREVGPPNAHACLHSSPEAFFRFYIPRLLSPAQPSSQ